MKKRIVVYFLAFFVFVGSILMVYGSFLQVRNINFIRNSLSTQAIISKIVCDEPDPKRTVYCDSYVKYEVNGEIYEANLMEWNSKMKVGDTLNIYYSPKDPTQIKGNSGNYVGYIVIGMGVFCLVGCLVIFLQVKQKH